MSPDLTSFYICPGNRCRGFMMDLPDDQISGYFIQVLSSK